MSTARTARRDRRRLRCRRRSAEAAVAARVQPRTAPICPPNSSRRRWSRCPSASRRCSCRSTPPIGSTCGCTSARPPEAPTTRGFASILHQGLDGPERHGDPRCPRRLLFGARPRRRGQSAAAARHVRDADPHQATPHGLIETCTPTRPPVDSRTGGQCVLPIHQHTTRENWMLPMEFTELADYPVSAGTLTEWLPSAPFDSDRRPGSTIPGRPRTSTRPACVRPPAPPVPSTDRGSGTAFEIAGHARHRGSRACAERVDRPARGAAKSREHQLDHGRAQPAHRRRGAGSGRSPSATATGPAARDNFAHLAELFDGCTSPLSWPSYAFATLVPPGPDDRFTVFLAADHAIIDGLSVVIVAQEIEALYRQARDGIDADLFPVGSYVDFGARERNSAAELDPGHPVVELWRSTLDHCGGRYPSSRSTSATRTPARCRRAACPPGRSTRTAADAFTLACRKLGHSFFAGYPRVPGHRRRRARGRAALRGGHPDAHQERPAAGRVGRLVRGLGPICFEVRRRPVVRRTGRARARRRSRRPKPAARYPYERVSEVLTTAARPRFVVSYMDLRFVPAATQWPEWNARALRSKQYDARRPHLGEPHPARGEHRRPVPRHRRGGGQRAPLSRPPPEPDGGGRRHRYLRARGPRHPVTGRITGQ